MLTVQTYTSPINDGRTKKHFHPAFTIVELLIVVVVIAIIATISLVAYRGIQDRAETAVLESDLTLAAKQLAMDNATDGFYPSDHTIAGGGSGLGVPDGLSGRFGQDIRRYQPPSRVADAGADTPLFDRQRRAKNDRLGERCRRRRARFRSYHPRRTSVSDGGGLPPLAHLAAVFVRG